MSKLSAVLNRVVNDYLRPYQREWMRNILTQRYTVLLGARQVGKTTSIALVAIALALGVGGKAANVYIVSRSQAASSDFLRRLKQILRAINTYVKICGKQDSTTAVELINGKTIYAIASKPEAIQGFTGHVIIDELCANQWDHEFLFSQCLSVASSSTDLKLVIISNAGIRHCFLDMFLHDPAYEERREGFYLNTTTIHDAYGKDLPQNILDVQKAISVPEWDKFYLCKFVDANFCPWDVSEFRYDVDTGKGDVYIGVDPGFSNNPCGIVVVRRTQTAIHVIESLHLFDTTSEEIERTVGDLVSKYNPRATYVDSGAVGRDLAIHLSRKYAAVQVNTTNKARNLALNDLLMFIKEGRITFEPARNAPIIQDLQRVERHPDTEVWELPQYKVSGRKNDIHCDAVDALINVLSKTQGSIQSKGVTTSGALRVGGPVPRGMRRR